MLDSKNRLCYDVTKFEVCKGCVNMYRVLFLGHGNLSIELLRSAELILGEQPSDSVQAFPLPPHQDMVAYLALVERFLINAGKMGTIIFTDLAGGSPFLTAAQAYRKYSDKMPLEIVTGMNLPMIIEALSAREFSTVEEGRETALAEGRRGVRAFSTELATQVP